MSTGMNCWLHRSLITVAQTTLYKHMGFLSARIVDITGVQSIMYLALEGSKGFPTLFLGVLLGIGKGSEFSSLKQCSHAFVF